jgi:O-antigen/teichoic acid export membrane protein
MERWEIFAAASLGTGSILPTSEQLMDLVQRIAKNTLSLLFASAISLVLGLFYSIYTARYLGPERYGTISFAIAFIGLFSILMDIGIQQLALREIARDKSLVDKYLANAIVLKALLSVITFAIIALTINILKYPDITVKVVYIIALSTILASFSSMLSSIFQAFEKMEYSSVGSILGGASMLAGGLFAINRGFSIMGFALIYVFSNSIVLIYNIIITRKFEIYSHIEINYRFIKSLIRRALPFGIGGIFLVYYVWIARVLLSMMVNNEAVGYYTAAYNLMASLNFVPSAFVAALFPLMAIFFKGSTKSLDKVFRIGIKYMYMLALPMAVGVNLLGNEIITLIYGTKFLPAVMALDILIWAEFFIFIDILLGQMLISINKEKITMINAGLGAALNIGLNLALIPKLGIEGSSFATLATEFYFFVISFAMLHRYGHTVDLRNLLFKPLIATSIMAVFIINFSHLHVFVLIPIAAALYFAILYLIKYISGEDISLIKQALAVRKSRFTA